MHPTLRLGHYQCEYTPGDFDANAERVMRGLEWARRERIDLMCFPETNLTGFYEDASEARRVAQAIDGPEITVLVKRTAGFDAMFIVGLCERRGSDLFNTALVIERGRIVGRYSKACAEPGYTPGREFPVFERNGVRFGVVICADSGFIEPSRILALRGARLIVAPHANFIQPEWLLDHYRVMLADHAARAIENAVWFFRGNSVRLGPRDPGIGYLGVGYGDSYLMDPTGQIVARSQLLTECFLSAEIEFRPIPEAWARRSRHSATELSEAVREALRK